MSYINRIKDVEIKLPDIRGSFGGEYRLEAFQGVEFPKGSGNVFEFAGTRRVCANWFENIVTDIGLDLYGTGTGGLDYGHVGTGNTPESATDTALVAFVAGVEDASKTPAAQGTPPYFGHQTVKYRFPPNFGGGNININEVAVSTTVTTGNCTSRSLTKNSGGSPVSVPVLATEYLDLYYKRRNYPAHIVEATGAPDDLTGSIDISGTSYGYTLRPAMVTRGGSLLVGTGAGWGTGLGKEYTTTSGFGVSTSWKGVAYDESAALGAVTSVISADENASETDEGEGTYTGDSYARELWWQWDGDAANFDVGIGGLLLKTAMGAYQLLFDTPVTKIEAETFTYYHNFIWTRKETWV
jgi:hypothetical protein